MRFSQYIAKLLACTLVAITICGPVLAEPIKEEQVFAKILVELPRYVQISSETNALPTLCIDTQDDLYRFTNALQKSRKTYGSVKLYSDDLKQCQFLYTDNIKSARKLIAAASGQRTIIISNYHSFIDEGGAIGLSNNNGVIGIELNLSTAEEKHAMFSPDLIELSGRVIR